jgi:hypothetical protein
VLYGTAAGVAFHDRLRARMLSGGKVDRHATLLWLQQELKRYQRETP